MTKEEKNGWKEIAKTAIEESDDICTMGIIPEEFEDDEEFSFNTYSKRALATSICPEGMDILYPLIGLTGETGEVAEKIKKVYRDKAGYFDPITRWEILKELGDCLWYINKMVVDLGFTLEEAAMVNLEKCYKRREEGTLHGNGDNR